jgi:hypothetical protein
MTLRDGPVGWFRDRRGRPAYHEELSCIAFILSRLGAQSAVLASATRDLGSLSTA